MTSTERPLTYRVGSEADAERLGSLNSQLIRDEGHRNPVTQPELVERMRGWLSAGYVAVLFEIDREVVAYALFRERPHEVYLRQLFVVRDRRREGIGREAIDILRTKVWPATKRLTVNVLVQNEAAVAFWRAVGYRDYALTLEILPDARD